MELFTKLYGAWLLFTYHCFDRIVISGYLMGMQRCGQVVYWLQNVLGIRAIDKAALSKRSGEYVSWVEAFARKQKVPLEWWEKGVNKEEYVQPYLQRAERAGRWGVYFIFQAMEQGCMFCRDSRKCSRRTEASIRSCTATGAGTATTTFTCATGDGTDDSAHGHIHSV